MKNRPNLLIITGSFPRSPQDETCGYIREFARALAMEFDVQALAPADRNASRWPEDDFRLTRSNPLLPAALDPLEASRDFNELSSQSLIVKLASAVSLLAFFAKAFRLALKSDIVCSHWMLPSGLIGAFISRALGLPHIAVEHSGALHLLARTRSGGLIARFIANNSDRIITVSADLKEKLIKLCPEARGKVEVVPMGIRMNRNISQSFHPNLNRSHISDLRTVLFIGRLTEIKGMDVLLRAMAGIKGAQLIIAGDGELKNELERLARELSVDAKFPGAIKAHERDRLLAACEVVVIPSRVMSSGRTEGMPVVCLEAMAAGRPVIASRAGGLAEVISDGYNGLLFEPGDHQMLAERLRLVLSDKELRQRLSANGRETAARYDWSQVGSQFSEIINSALRIDESAIYDQRRKTRRANG